MVIGGCMIRAIYFSLCFGLALFGLLVVSHISIPIGLGMFFIFIIKFLLMLPQYKEE